MNQSVSRHGKVSIVTPCYNSAAYVSETIQSVLSQTYPDWELLLVNDRSTDTTGEVLETWSTRDPRIRIIHNEINLGPALTRQRGKTEATGMWLAFLDSDDLWYPTKLDRQLDFMQADGIDFSYTGYVRISMDGSRTGAPVYVPGSLSYEELISNPAIATSTAMLRAESVKGISFEPGWGYDDFVFWLACLKKIPRAYALPLPMMKYRAAVPGSVSGKKLRSARWVWRILRERERMSILESIYPFSSYAVRAVMKRATLTLLGRKTI